MPELPFWKAILITIGIIAVALGIIYVATLLGLNDPWVPFLALTLWGALGMKMEQAPPVFIGGAAGLLLSLAMEALPDLYGDWVAVFPLVTLVLAISCHIKGLFPLVCNFGLFVFLTVGSADIIQEQRLQVLYLQNLAFGAVLFWFAPWIFLKLRPKGVRDTSSES